ncbi:DUF2889 domain-containing protein [Rhabdothermincola salaria]|uniref:DUF2889 domain-containing protein n=1 Tax=Rhabdothermincola salaria TaxID=2903142 RepID=UPI001E3E2B97|nr:DUF2889 domain-containing protein [Rhabdothermincola salaria]MCD9624066.1 DUF2889 domain-containing protein [Rhabdothermincola salaria]
MAEQLESHPGIGVGLRRGPLTYRRRIEIVPGAGSVDAAMEDYIHHFRVRLAHDGTRITAAEAVGVRVPWSTCPVGAAGLAALAGTSLDDAVLADRWVDDRRTQCVHTVDLAALAAAHALDAQPLVYEVHIELASFVERRARLTRDGVELLDWELHGQEVVGDGPYAGMALDRRPFSQWLETRVPADEREPVVVLRRACSIGLGRLMDLDAIEVASDARPADESCHTYRTGVPELSRRCTGTARETEVDPPGTPIPGGPLAR